MRDVFYIFCVYLFIFLLYLGFPENYKMPFGEYDDFHPNNKIIMTVILDDSILFFDESLSLYRKESFDVLNALDITQQNLYRIEDEQYKMSVFSAYYDLQRQDDQTKWSELNEEEKYSLFYNYIENINDLIQLERIKKAEELKLNVQSNYTTFVIFDKLNFFSFFDFYDPKQVYNFIYKMSKFLLRKSINPEYWFVKSVDLIEVITKDKNIRFSLRGDYSIQINRVFAVLNKYDFDSIKYLDVSSEVLSLMFD